MAKSVLLISRQAPWAGLGATEALDIAFEKNYDRILMKGGLKDFLLITETPHGISSGSIINFILEGGSVLKFEISDSNAKKMGISINSKLSTMTSAIKR